MFLIYIMIYKKEEKPWVRILAIKPLILAFQLHWVKNFVAKTLVAKNRHLLLPQRRYAGIYQRSM